MRRGAAGLSLAAAVVTAAVPAPVAAQQAVDVGLGLALATPLVVDGNGTRVRLSPAPLVAVGVRPASWSLGRVRAGVAARVATAAVRLEDGEERWRGGHAWTLDLVATASPTRAGRVEPYAGAGVLVTAGGRDVAAVDALARRPRPVVEGGVRVRRRAASATALHVAAQGFRLTAPGGEAGGVLRVLAMVTHAW